MRLIEAGLVIAGFLLVGACGGPTKSSAQGLTGGDATRGAKQIPLYGCGACHSIPGIPGAHGIVGPPLAGIGGRMYVGGVLANSSENAVRWVQDPRAINPKTAMPTLGVTSRDANDIVTYLYSLK